MSELMPGQTLIAGLKMEKAVDLIWAPRLKNDNILNSSMGLNLYKVIPNVKDGVRLLHLRRRGHTLQSRKPCQWKPNFALEFRSDVLTVCDYEHMSDDCYAEEFDGTCTRALDGAGNMVNDIMENSFLSAVDAAALIAISEGITDDAYYIGWFSNKEIQTNFPWKGNMELTDEMIRSQVYDMLGKCNGWWAEIFARNDEDLPKEERVIALDSNDGTVAGNALNDPRAFFKAMLDAATPELRQACSSSRMEDRPVFLAQGKLFDAYYDQMSQLPNYTESSYMLATDGLPNPNFMKYNGLIIARMAEWDRFDDELGIAGKNLRCVLTVPQNLSIGCDAVIGSNGYSIAFERSTRLEDKGKVYRYAAIKLGARIAEPMLMVAAWNSSDTFVAA